MTKLNDFAPLSEFTELPYRNKHHDVVMDVKNSRMRSSRKTYVREKKVDEQNQRRHQSYETVACYIFTNPVFYSTRSKIPGR